MDTKMSRRVYYNVDSSKNVIMLLVGRVRNMISLKMLDSNSIKFCVKFCLPNTFIEISPKPV